ncbi:programmed cell death protein 1 [Elgaria multicarinata webbii]|uniref:programmed cell death protein 1 n=1 Tax=Elgaria multicarinata webbii TaxID=159646 RepID=UPI002FCD0171
MENLHQVVLMGACWLLLFCRSALLVKPSARFSPLQLSRPMGATAIFTCSVSNVFISDYRLSWYKLDSEGQPEKLATERKKYNVTQLNSKTYQMKILNVEEHDSGIYYCMLLAFSLNHTLTESNKANLTVTEKALEPGPQEEEEEEEEDMDNIGQADNNILLAAIQGAGLVLALALLCFFIACIIRRRQEQQKSHDENAPLEEEPPGMTVFTVDYGVLEFHAAENAQSAPLPKRSPADLTEYATIVFPHETPAPAHTDKRFRKQRSCPSRALPHRRDEGRKCDE